MKPNTIIIFLGLVMLLLPHANYAQSTFIFSNLGLGVDAPVSDTQGNLLFGTDYVAVLYGGPTPGSLTLAAMQTAHRDPMNPIPFQLAPGYFDGGVVEISTVLCGAYAWLQVRAWDTRLGNAYEEVAGLGLGGYGESGLFYARGGDPCGLPSPPEFLVGLESFSLRPIPEPASVGLWLLGLGLLGWSRWRQNQSRNVPK